MSHCLITYHLSYISLDTVDSDRKINCIKLNVFAFSGFSVDNETDEANYKTINNQKHCM